MRPHDLEKHIGLAALTPVEDTVENAHLRPVPSEPLALGLPHPLFDFHADEIQTQPVGVALDLCPARVVLGRRVAAPSATTVCGAGKDRVLHPGGNLRFDGVPGRANPAAHGVDDLITPNRKGDFRWCLGGQSYGRTQRRGEAQTAGFQVHQDRVHRLSLGVVKERSGNL